MRPAYQLSEALGRGPSQVQVYSNRLVCGSTPPRPQALEYSTVNFQGSDFYILCAKSASFIHDFSVEEMIV